VAKASNSQAIHHPLARIGVESGLQARDSEGTARMRALCETQDMFRVKSSHLAGINVSSTLITVGAAWGVGGGGGGPDSGYILSIPIPGL